MKNYILITDGKEKQFDTIEELKESIIPGFSQMALEELQKRMYEKVFGFCVLNHLQIISNQGVWKSNYEIQKEEKNMENAIIIENIDTYLLSLCKYRIISILEEKEHLYYAKNREIDWKENNYVLVDAIAKQALNHLMNGGDLS